MPPAMKRAIILSEFWASNQIELMSIRLTRVSFGGMTKQNKMTLIGAFVRRI